MPLERRKLRLPPLWWLKLKWWWNVTLAIKGARRKLLLYGHLFAPDDNEWWNVLTAREFIAVMMCRPSDEDE